MQAVILKCPPNAQFHFGKIAPDENTSLNDTSTYIHSDTLFSSIINVAAKILEAEELNMLIDWFKAENGVRVRISSGFYCLEAGGQYTYFLPKPVTWVAENTKKSKELKKIKKVAFISKKVWEEGIKPDQWKETCHFIQGKFIIHKSELEVKDIGGLSIYHTDSLPKVNVHKPNRDNSIYYQTNIQLEDNGVARVHFYFLLEQDLAEDEYKLLKRVLDWMPEEGIGGERTVGCGHLEGIEYHDFAMDFLATRYCGVSLVNPTEADLLNAEAYEIITRGGRPIGADIRLKRVKMMAEGAIFNEKVEGFVPDITPLKAKGTFLRYGKAFCLPVHSPKPTTT